MQPDTHPILHKIFSPEENIVHLCLTIFWGVVVVRLFSIIKSWYRKQPADWKQKVLIKFANLIVTIVSLGLFSYIAALAISETCNLVSSRISTSINQSLDKLAEPYLKPKFDGQWLGAGMSNNGSNNLVIVTMKIYNLGGPSVIRDWNLKATGIDGHIFYGKTFFPEPPNMYTVDNSGNTNDWVLSDSLVQKTKDIPVEHGGSRDGHVIFAIQNVNTDYLKSSTTTFQISFDDVNGTNYLLSTFSWPAPTP